MDLKQLILLKDKGYSNRKAAEILGVSRNTVNSYTRLFKGYKLSYKELTELDEPSLQDLFPDQSEIETHRYKELAHYFSYFQQELKKPGCTIQTLWKEYLEKHPDGYRHSQFAWHFNQWKQRVKVSCKLEHKAGEKLFVDFTGKKLHIIDKETGELQEVNVFVGILPSSQYTFVTATRTQNREDVINALNKCLTFFQGVPQAIVSDNLKAAVNKGSKYAPIVNKTLKDFAVYYNCVIDPTRPHSPTDKALVEGAVNLVYQRIFYPLSKHSFFNLKQLNEEIASLLEPYNNFKFSLSNTTRKQEFISVEEPYLQPLPEEPYKIRYFKQLKVQKMGYIYLSDDKHYYSVPFRFIGRKVEVQYTSSTVEVYYNRERVALHGRDYSPGKYSTNKNHLSSAHKAYTEWSLEFFQKKAGKIGCYTTQYITDLILQRQYPEIGYKQAQGVILLARQYNEVRIENACKRALNHPTCSYHTIENILKRGLDQEEFTEDNQMHIPTHPNIRGPKNYT